MANQNVHADLCPVCCQFYAAPNRTYCSTSCQIEARKFRERINHNIRLLSELGFKIERRNGIEFDINLPDDIKIFYPVNNHQFTFPPACFGIESLSGTALFNMVEAYIGKPALDIIKGFSFKDFNADLNFKYQFAYEVSLLAYNPKQTTICKTCSLSHIITNSGWDPEQDCCTDCTLNRIPF